MAFYSFKVIFLTTFMLGNAVAAAAQPSNAELFVVYKVFDLNEDTRNGATIHVWSNRFELNYNFIEVLYTREDLIRMNRKRGVVKSEEMIDQELRAFIALQKAEAVKKRYLNIKTGLHFYTANLPFETKAICIRDTLPIFNWKLLAADTIINGLVCKKASVEFKSQTYFAWYSPDIPFAIGPPPFSQLPGLIFKLWNNKGDEQYFLQQVDYPVNTEKQVQISAPCNGPVFMTEKQFFSENNRMINDMMRKFNAEKNQ